MTAPPVEPHAAPSDVVPRVADGAALAAEYVAAIDMIRAVRDVADQIGGEGVRHWSRPLGKVSADFFCTAEHPQFGWFALLADAAGHGLPAAVFTLHTPMLFRESVLMGMSLPSIYARIRRLLASQHVNGYFVCGIFVHVRGRDIEVINAGMPDALLLAADGRLAEAFASRHLPLGIESDERDETVHSQRYRLAIDEQAALLLCTDGLSEMGILDGSALGRDGLLDIARQGVDQAFDRLLDRIDASPVSPHDDISVALIPVPRRAGAEAVATAGQGVPASAPERQVLNVAAALRIVEHFDRGLVLTDAEQRILYVNPTFSAITGYGFDEAIGQTPRLLNSGHHDHEFYRAMWRTLSERGEWSGEIWNRRKDGTLYLEWLSIRTLRDPEGHVVNYLATFTVIHQQQAQDDRLRFLALHDVTTGLANRILLSDRGDQAIRRADRSERSLAVLFIDLDRFKSINDSLGHDIGDEVLVRVARRMEGVLREDDTLARFGGDEFVCLLPDIADRQDARLVAGKLLAALETPIDVAGHYFKISASIGISAYPSDCLTFDELIVQADRAMMSAKQAGGNMYRFFCAAMAAAVERQLEMEARLDAAIRNGELELHYQPKLDLARRAIVGAEALVRWRDPERGLVPPGDFIPVAEKSHLIAEIGLWVLRTACDMLARCGDKLPRGFHVAVNVSPMQFERGDLASEVGRALDETGVAPLSLQLEVTESMIIRDARGVAVMLQRIADMGVAVALDDFGTGYSNLGALSQLPLHAFKLDQSFVRAVDTDHVKASIARSIWHLADGLGKEVVAEGVETCEECLKIKGMGYHFGQGYRFGKPMPEADFMRYVADWDGDSCRCPACAAPAAGHCIPPAPTSLQ